MRGDRNWLIGGIGLIAAGTLTGIAAAYHNETVAIENTIAARHFAEARSRNDPESLRRMEELRHRFGRPYEMAAERDPGAALAAGVAFLLKKQSADGSWRSEVYATFKDGTALTPLVVHALQEAGSKDAQAIRRGCAFLAKLIKPEGTTEGGEAALDYPVYTAALSVQALSHEIRRDPKKNAGFNEARNAWLKYLRQRQLTEKLGWKPGDKQFGGWGYCRFIPRKPEPGAIAPPLVESNLSATLFALEALKTAGVKDAEVYEKAMVFVRRCQNEDGGFHFIYDDPVRNKAGAAPGQDDQPPRFFSYGSTTADGLRALALSPNKDDGKRRDAAKRWLERHFAPDRHPGKYIPTHEANREAVYYYYAASAAKALRLEGVENAGGKSRAPALRHELARRQADDGRWENPVELVRENDPLVATANALIALANCPAP